MIAANLLARRLRLTHLDESAFACGAVVNPRCFGRHPTTIVREYAVTRAKWSKTKQRIQTSQHASESMLQTSRNDQRRRLRTKDDREGMRTKKREGCIASSDMMKRLMCHERHHTPESR